MFPIATTATGLLAFGSVAATFQSSYVAPQVDFGFSKMQNAKVDGRVFSLDGVPTYFAGTNAWWLPYLMEQESVDQVMSEIAGSDLKVVRIWAFGTVNDVPEDESTWFQLLNSTGWYYNYGANGLQRLDYVVHTAEKYGLRLVMPMNNNWYSLGGIQVYNNAFGGNSTSWYTDSMSQKAYRDYVKLVVERYHGSPAVFSWELMNEPRCHGCPSNVVTDWAADISKYIKGLDHRHLVTLGDEGWFAPGNGVGDGSYAYSGLEGVDFVANLGIPTLDYGVYHLYPNSWGYNYTWGNTWIKEHNYFGERFFKPVVAEEYGTPFPHNHTGTEKPWQNTILKDTQTAYDSFWQFGTDTVEGLTDWDVNTIWYNDTEFKTLGSNHARAMMAKPVTKAVLA